MTLNTMEFLAERIALADQLRVGRDAMEEPRDLPGRFGRAVKAIERVLQAMQCESVLGGGWAVWRHGYAARVTEDIDIALPADRIEEFLRVACVSGFELLPQPPGRWPKVTHKDSGVKVDILPEGAQPGTASRPAPTLIPHPRQMGAVSGRLSYMRLLSLIELKLAAGRPRDEFDVAELIRVNLDQVEAVRKHLQSVHSDYVAAFDKLVERAREQEDQ